VFGQTPENPYSHFLSHCVLQKKKQIKRKTKEKNKKREKKSFDQRVYLKKINRWIFFHLLRTPIKINVEKTTLLSLSLSLLVKSPSVAPLLVREPTTHLSSKHELPDPSAWL